MTPFLLATVGILVIVYMTYPRFRRRRLSAARFFRDLPPPRKGQSRLRWGKIRMTLPFFLQLLLLMSLTAALYLVERKISGDDIKSLGLRIVIDTSASMGTQQQEETRMTAAKREVDAVLLNAQKAAAGNPLCFSLSALDLELRDLIKQGDSTAIKQAAAALTPRPLGTDLDILRQLVTKRRMPEQEDDRCMVSHLVVITDQPAPNWVVESKEISIIWRDIGTQTTNAGFTDIRSARNPLTGQVSDIRLEVTTYGPPALDATVVVYGPGDKVVMQETLAWQRNRFWQGGFTPDQPGRYRLKLTPADAYPLDNEVAVTISGGKDIRVDWQLPDRRLMTRMDWQQDDQNPQLRITSRPLFPLTVPTLIVDSGYGSIRSTPVEIRDFIETNPLLKDLNLDATETIGIPGVVVPEGFQPVLRGMNNQTWLAYREDPVCAVIPGLPTDRDDITGRFSTTVFFNALRMLLQKMELPPLYTLTTAQAPEPGLNHLPLHKDEGNTQRTPRSVGKLETLRPITGKTPSKPFWPILIMTAALLFLAERTLTAFKQRD